MTHGGRETAGGAEALHELETVWAEFDSARYIEFESHTLRQFFSNALSQPFANNAKDRPAVFC